MEKGGQLVAFFAFCEGLNSQKLGALSRSDAGKIGCCFSMKADILYTISPTLMIFSWFLPSLIVSQSEKSGSQ